MLSELGSLDDECVALIGVILRDNGVSNKTILSGMRRKMELLIGVTDVSVVTAGLVEASGLKRETAEIHGRSLAAIASRMVALRSGAASPVSGLSASAPHASVAPPPCPAAAYESALPAGDASSAPRAMEGVDEAVASSSLTAASADAVVAKRTLDASAFSTGESPERRRQRVSEDALVPAASAKAHAPPPLSLPERSDLLAEHGSGGLLAFFRGAIRGSCFPLEKSPFPRVFNLDVIGPEAHAAHIGNAIYREMAQLKSELDDIDVTVWEFITSLPDVELECVPYTEPQSLRIDGPQNTQHTGVTIHALNESAGVFAYESADFCDATAYFRIDIELSSGAASSVVSFKIGRTNPVMAKLAAFFVLAAPNHSLWKASRVVRVVKPPSGSVPLTPSRPAPAAGRPPSLASVPLQGAIGLLQDGADGGVGRDGK